MARRYETQCTLFYPKNWCTDLYFFAWMLLETGDGINLREWLVVFWFRQFAFAKHDARQHVCAGLAHIRSTTLFTVLWPIQSPSILRDRISWKNCFGSVRWKVRIFEDSRASFMLQPCLWGLTQSPWLLLLAFVLTTEKEHVENSACYGQSSRGTRKKYLKIRKNISDKHNTRMGWSCRASVICTCRNTVYGNATDAESQHPTRSNITERLFWFPCGGEFA